MLVFVKRLTFWLILILWSIATYPAAGKESVEATRDHEGQGGRSAVHLELDNFLINQSSANKRTISFSLYLDDY